MEGGLKSEAGLEERRQEDTPGLSFLLLQIFFNFMATVTICSDLGTQENNICHHFHFLPFYLPWSGGTGCHDLIFLNVEF